MIQVEGVANEYFVIFKPLPNPRLKQIRGGNCILLFNELYPFPYCLSEGDRGRVQQNKR
jgi:hypothetical protein